MLFAELRRIFPIAALICIFHDADALYAAQLQHGTVVVIVLDVQQSPVADAEVVLTDPLGAVIQALRTDAAGRVAFADVAPGRYAVRAGPENAALPLLPVQIVDALPIEVTLRVPSGITDRVVVEAAVFDEPSSRGSLAAASLARLPMRTRARGLQDAVTTLPGWSTEDNGLMHARGVDDGFLYVIDGVPVYERLDAVSGITPDLLSIGSINVVTGYVPPEFGYKAGGVIEVRSATATSWNGGVEIGGGSDASRHLATAFGGRVGERLGLRAGVAATASDRFLDPVHPDNLHNNGGQSHTFGQVDWSVSSGDRLSGGWGYGRSHFDVPNNEQQDVAGQDQRQRIGQTFFDVSWQRLASADLVWQASGYHRRTGSLLTGSPADTPLEAHADRSLIRSGALLAMTRQWGQHSLKAGTEIQRLDLDEDFRFAVTDEEAGEDAGFTDEVLQFDRDNPFVFAGTSTPVLVSAFVQDTWRPRSRITLSGGVRFDRTKLLLPRTQFSPRAGVAFRLAPETVLRGAVSRFFQPPQPENLLLSSSPEARVLSSIEVGDAVGGADVEPERQWSTDVGIEHRIGRLRVDASYWLRRAVDVADPNVFVGTTIIFPNAVAKGRAHGVEMRVEMAAHRGWTAYANAAVSRVIQTGPIDGGLFLEDEIEEIGDGEEFAPDHDQRFNAGGGVTWEHASGTAVSVTARYETGTPVQREGDDLDELLAQPGADLVDFESGRVKPRAVVSAMLNAPLLSRPQVRLAAVVEALNLFNARYAYNFGNPFSGTHFGAPRSLSASLRVTFR